jgi:hypothetical protein
MEINIYNTSKIYKIVDINYTKTYYGSTTQKLSQRMALHRSCYKKNKLATSANSIFDEFGVDNCKIELVEEVNCSNKDQLLRIEGKYIKENECVNKRIAGQTHKEYVENNKEKIKAIKKEYANKNKEKINAHQKEYAEKNKDKLKEYYQNNKEKRKEYYNINKDKILKQQKTYNEIQKNNPEKKQKATTYIREYYHKNKDMFNLSKFKHSKIYKIVCPDTKKYFLGITSVSNIDKCFDAHMTKMNKSENNIPYMFMKMISATNWKIELIMECNLKSYDELKQLEEVYITAYQDEIINSNKDYTDEIVKKYLDGRFDDSILPEKYRNKNV